LTLPLLGFSFLTTFTNNSSKQDFLILGGGLSNDYTTKSNQIRVINIKELSVTSTLLRDEDYFFDNQVLEVDQDLIAVGFIQAWKVMKSNGKASKYSDGISQKCIGKDVIMPGKDVIMP
jgi:hypothetical protein